MHNENIVLEILNYLLSIHGLAKYANCPNGGELGNSYFNYIWSKKPMRIQFLMHRSALFLPKDFEKVANPSSFKIKYDSPYCFLEFEVDENLDIPSIKSMIDRLSVESKNLKIAIVSEVEKNLSALEKLCGNELLVSPTLNELQQRLQLLKNTLDHEFYISCDKINIPVNLVFPDDIVFEKYQNFFSENFLDYKAVCDQWYKEFRAKNKYP